jgi:hypothetical protein
MSENIFTDDIEIILENIRINSILLSKEHKKAYIVLKDTLKYYRLPVIIISALNSVISIGAQPFLKQVYISLCNCLLALICGLIGSIELFFGVNNQMEIELSVSKDFYILATDIYKMLSLKLDNRQINGKAFLDDCYSRYIKLIETSGTLKSKIEDQLAPLPKLIERKISFSSKASDTPSDTSTIKTIVEKLHEKDIKEQENSSSESDKEV